MWTPQTKNQAQPHLPPKKLIYLKNAGYKVWLDIEQMKGSTLEAMAEAVEQSAVVVICATEKYKDSPNCRLEGEYTASLRKPFIPLVMQQGYKPSGWLGILFGSRLYYRFLDEKNWDSNIAVLVDVIMKTVPAAPLLPPPDTHEDKPKSKPLPSKESVPNVVSPINWGTQEVSDWLKKADLGHLSSCAEKHELDGKCLLVLLHLTNEFESFKKFLKDDMEIAGAKDILRFFFELKNSGWHNVLKI